MCGRYFIDEYTILNLDNVIEHLERDELSLSRIKYNKQTDESVVGSTDKSTVTPASPNKSTVTPASADKSVVQSASTSADKSTEIFPTNIAPIISLENNKIQLSAQSWGYPKFDKKGVIINARAETVMEKLTFAEGIRYHRLLIPMAGFYEWNSHKEKISFFRGDSETLFIAGFYDIFEEEPKFCMITTASNKSMEATHHRMPLVLENNQLEAWLRDDRYLADILAQEPVALAQDQDYKQLTFFDI